MRRLVAGFAVAAVALGAFLLLFDPAAMWATLRTAAPLPVAAGLLATLLAVGCWAEAMRRILVAAGSDVGYVRGFAAFGAGMFAKQVVPMGNASGPAIMAVALDREADIGFNRSLAVVTIDGFIGMVVAVLLALVGVAYVALSVPPTRLVGVVLVGVAVVAVVVASLALLLVYRRSAIRFLALGIARFVRGTLGRVSRRVEAALAPARIDAGLSRYFETFDAVAADRRSLAISFAFALVGWTLFAVPLYTSAAAVGTPLAFGVVLFVVPAGGLATTVPLPGGLGGVEFAVAGMVIALTAIDPAVAGAMVLLYRVCVYWFLVAIGGACLVYAATDLATLAAEAPSGHAPVEGSER